ncbi:hypothetical protein OG909_30520 [Streptomyces sp. NBC_01754]|uniref:hypothetical protein n=1 Tax=Streptomyces sp. NBC_01754 TaxID=2975930 RepID=UPI002DDC75C0|nr:hypothetical protein [Streptomyces sp. NBC_01754]WSC96288.1 hypothetical protein OG909_30520 [Streptomyces sp. NBC_01754]
MATPEQADSPTSLYGVASSVLGVIALVTAVLADYAGIALPLLSGSLAVTFAVLGLSNRLDRARCAVGLVAGGLGVLHPVFLVASFGG